MTSSNPRNSSNRKSSSKNMRSNKTDNEWIDLYAHVEQRSRSNNKKKSASPKPSERVSSRSRDAQKSSRTRSASRAQSVSRTLSSTQSEHGRGSLDKHRIADDTKSCHTRICFEKNSRRKSSSKIEIKDITIASKEETKKEDKKQQKQDKEDKKKQKLDEEKEKKSAQIRSNIQKKREFEQLLKQKRLAARSVPKQRSKPQQSTRSINKKLYEKRSAQSLKKMYDELAKESMTYNGTTKPKYLNKLFGPAA
eukprot:CAMPEP_0194199440 /NCGR_PEP_ID=MMETSP0156-20130528/457_1 /TAXON_ID=33649 /ORGANISM="Thalassionema nitzschioides, Strain L26-B" /LENGTH=250 /DNA_ID=CAMNT_0038924333 /DNA_START=52 /DNA_END=804 /DNA_ORIENTATION=-